VRERERQRDRGRGRKNKRKREGFPQAWKYVSDWEKNYLPYFQWIVPMPSIFHCSHSQLVSYQSSINSQAIHMCIKLKLEIPGE
jgi:hypothetical protein